MMEVMDYFKQICKIPHGSHDTALLRDFLVAHTKKNGFEFEIDVAGNIYAYKGTPKICLQSHYDMVCVGRAPDIELESADGYLSAKDSSLGADNGIGVAIMMASMDRFSDIEVVFTNDEEVGLCGVQYFEANIKSKKLLNLDSEEDDRVTIGCAGSVDMYAKRAIKRNEFEGFVYEIRTLNFKGGHSGVQIDENIPNAIKHLARFIRENGGKVVKFDGGERRNSIAANAYVLVVFDKKIDEETIDLDIKFIDRSKREIYDFSDDLIDMLCLFSQGVRAYNKKLSLPEDSINLSTAKELGDGSFEVLFFARSMSKDGLENSKFETKLLAERLNFDFRSQNQTTPWKPQINEFSEVILKEMKKFSPNAKFAAVHAGLECGVFIAKDSSVLAASIGPNIYSPHSIHEKVELESVDKIKNAVFSIIESL